MSPAEFDLPKEIQTALYRSPVKPEKIPPNQFILAKSADETQRIRWRNNGLITLLSLDIKLNDRLFIPVLTVSQEKRKLRVSFALINPASVLVNSAIYSATDRYPAVSAEVYALDPDEAELLLASGAFPVTGEGQLPQHINVYSVARNISGKFFELARTPDGFKAVKVSELVQQLFVAN